MKVTRKGGLHDFVDSGRPNPINDKDAKKIKDAYAQANGYGDHEDYLEHKDDAARMWFWVIVIGFIVGVLVILLLLAIFLWGLIAPVLGL